jgi:hypothetical protein
MNRLCWWLVDLVSRGLEPDECDAVRGDLTESGETAGQALWQILGLFVRRQAALWLYWRPWLAVSFAVPLGILFCIVSRWLAYSSAIYLWVYTNYWSPTVVENAAYRHDIFQYVFSFLLDYGVLAGVAWSSALALGFLSRRSLPLNCAISVMFVGDCLVAAPRHSVNAAVFEHAFYRILVPLLLQTFLVLFPSLWGMRQGLRLVNRLKENHT